jgi:1-acyl-sn-glycerol-3-phosphate acyltransferase
MTTLGVEYDTEWGRSTVVRGIRRVLLGGIILPYTRWATSMRVVGSEHLPQAGPVIFVANHASHLDTPLALAALPAALRRRTVVAGAVDTFFLNAKKAFVTVLTFNVIPFERHKVNRRSADNALRLLRAGWNLLIYPEGGRTTTGTLMEFKAGAAYLAERGGLTVVPLFMNGAGNWMGPSYAKAERFTSGPNRRRSPVTVTIGQPLTCGEGENLRVFNSRIQAAVVALAQTALGDASYGNDLTPEVD